MPLFRFYAKSNHFSNVVVENVPIILPYPDLICDITGKEKQNQHLFAVGCSDEQGRKKLTSVILRKVGLQGQIYH